MAKQFRITMMLIVVFMLLPISANTTVPTHAQTGSEVNVPERVEVETFLTAGTGNDIFFQSNVDNALLPHAYHSTQVPYDLYSYDGVDFSNLGPKNPFIDFTAPETGILYHASNFSTGNEALDLEYTATFYDLTGGEDNQTGIETTILFEDEMSGFRFDATLDEPLIIDIKIKGESELQRLDIFLVSPSGEVFDYSVIENQFQTFINEFIPIVPRETGIYTLYLSPPNDDVILEGLNIYTSPPVVELTSGYTDKWTGTETQTIFFEFTIGNNTGVPTFLELTSRVFINTSIPYNDQTFLLGNLDIDYFTPLTGAFGASFPATVLQGSQTSTFVAVTATPPNENNQFVAAEKKELGLKPGFDVDYAFWAEQFELGDEFTLDENILVEAPNQVNTNAYYFSTTSEELIGMNATTGADAVIIDLDDPLNFYLLDSTANDIRLVPSHDATLLPAGDYVIFISGVVGEDAQVYTIDMLSINLDEEINRFFSFGEAVFFKLAANQPIHELFDVTYLGKNDANASVDLEFRLYDSTFSPVYADNFVFNEYYDNLGTNRVSDNNTQFGSTVLTTQYNIQQGFLRISSIGNEVFNQFGNDSVIDDPNYSARFSIQRLNYLDVWAETDGNQYESSTFTSSANEDINGSKNSIVLVYKYISDTMSGYRFRFSAINATYTILTFVDWTDTWHNQNVNTPVVIDGQPTYNYDLEFGTNMLTNFGFVVILNPLNNGTFTLDFSKYVVQETPGIDIGSINTEVYNPPYDPDQVLSGESDDEGFLEENLVPLAVGTIIIVAAAGTFVIIRRRGSSL